MDNITSIGDYAFQSCTKLKAESEFIVPKGVTSIGKNAFMYCKFSAITLSEELTEIGASAFQDCSKLTSITIPSKVTSIASDAFFASGINKIMVDQPLNSISGSPWGATGAAVTWKTES